MIYNESPTAFETIIVNLIDEEDVDISVNPQFVQQEKRKTSIPDLCIYQQSFAIFFETKLKNGYNSDQILRHIKEVGSEEADRKILFLLCNFESKEFSTNDDEFQELYKAAKENYEVNLIPISFDGFLAEIERVSINETLDNIIEEFRSYLDQEGLLPKWKYMLDVVNCGKTIHEVENGFYACPNTGGAYSHRRAKYFGAYKDKKVSKIYEIDGIVITGVKEDKKGNDFSIKWNNKDPNEDDEMIERARKIVANWEEWRKKESSRVPMQIFLLSNGTELPSGFIKGTPRGLYGN